MQQNLLMTVDDLRATLASSTPPPALRGALLALWHDARGDWDMAHRVAQDVDDASGAWVHAYLHRKEGDESNAAYWYRRAGKPIARGSLDEEWTGIAAALLDNG
jgi:hypothetical protein